MGALDIEIKYRKLEVEDQDEAVKIDCLLRYVFDGTLFVVYKRRNPNRWVFRFWADEEEFEAIQVLLMNESVDDWDSEYYELLENDL